MEQNIIQSK